MAARENSPFSAEHIAEFNRIQALRPVMLRRVTDLLEIWRCCANKTCKRSRGCQRDDGACLATFMQAIPDSLDSFSQRADQRTSVMDSILRKHPRNPPRL